MEGEAEMCLGGTLPAVGAAVLCMGTGGQLFLTTGAFPMLFCSHIC